LNYIKVITYDNTPTLFHPELNEHYHSINGALQESLHVFINAGLKMIEKNEINILEVGFGTGLNALLTFKEIQNTQKHIFYEAIEKYPLPQSIINELFNDDLFRNSVFSEMHKINFGKIQLSENFILNKIETDLIHYKPKIKFDLIYFDAFSPEKQPELWTESIFKTIYNATSENGLFVSYSSKGIVKEALRKAGFKVYRLKGPAGKRHMVRAVK